jgi:tetratricopeptide (TPR) repeat protein
MLDQISAALDRQDYQAAHQLIKEMLKRSPDDPWLQFYLGRLYEVSGKPKAAEDIYRKLLQLSTHAKLVSQVRQGLERLGAVKKKTAIRRPETASRGQTPGKRTISPSLSAASDILSAPHSPLGFMVLPGIAGEARTAAIQTFCQVMQLDAYTVRGLLPSHGWRLYRTAPVHELRAWGEALQTGGVPVLWASLPELAAVKVFQVHYFQELSPQAIAVCQNDADQVGEIAFDWTEITHRVEGVLPLFSPVVDLGYRDQLEWKESIVDYAHICDLHLPKRNCILRLQDRKYNFQRSAIAQSAYETVRQHWNRLLTELSDRQPCPVSSEFARFADTTGDFAEPLSRLNPQISLSRAADCYLDSAFHLYSLLTFLKFNMR